MFFFSCISSGVCACVTVFTLVCVCGVGEVRWWIPIEALQIIVAEYDDSSHISPTSLAKTFLGRMDEAMSGCSKACLQLLHTMSTKDDTIPRPAWYAPPSWNPSCGTSPIHMPTGCKIPPFYTTAWDAAPLIPIQASVQLIS